jgi:uncharacterized protein (DUF1501 family)
MLSRRSFLKVGVQTSSLIALAPTVPGFLARTARAARPQRDGRVLVVIQLDGGNDGINTVVPFKDDGYAKYRAALRLPAERLLKLTKEIGLHPAMRDAAKLVEDGRLAIVQGVGYPNPTRSHFRSMAVWHTADLSLVRGVDAPDADSEAALGWIGRALDGVRRPADGSPDAVFVGSGSFGTVTFPPALRSRHSSAAALTRPEDALLTLKGDARSIASGTAPGADDLADFVRRNTLAAYTTSERMTEVLRLKESGRSYPENQLGQRLRSIARLIKAGVGTRVFYTVQPGYDTHAGQTDFHHSLLEELATGLRVFLEDLSSAKLAERVAVLCFSEFGRRVQENNSAGTDHGTAGPVFVAGPGVRAGLVGETPRLLDLQDGDLKMTVDFRRVYAAVLEDWLGLPARPTLGGTFQPLPLFRI